MKRIFTLGFSFLLVVSLMLSGCATWKKGIAVPVGCEKSLIYNNVPYADLVGGVITITGLETFKAMKKSGKDLTPVFTSLEKIQMILNNPTLTYTGFVTALALTNSEINSYAGIELIFLSTLIDSMYGKNLTVDACDSAYLQRQINNQIMLLRVL